METDKEKGARTHIHTCTHILRVASHTERNVGQLVSRREDVVSAQ